MDTAKDSSTPLFPETIATKSDENQLVQEKGFSCVVSMYDGVVLYTSPSITDSLGFPRDMWLGRSFIDFVHPKDRQTLASQITSGIAVPFSETKGGFHKETKSHLYVMLRKYRGLRSVGYGVTARETSYEPYRLMLSFREGPDDGKDYLNGEKKIIPYTSTVLLFICASPVRTIYKRKQDNSYLLARKI